MVKWLWDETRVREVVSSNPGAAHWLGHFSHLFAFQRVLVLEETTENERRNPHFYIRFYNW